MQRTLIIGCSGSGKTTLSRLLAESTGLPVIHLDQEYFMPDWKEPSPEAWARTVQGLAARDQWIMEGNFSGTFKYRMPRADTIIFLDQPTGLCLWRVLRRVVRYYGQVRPGSAPGCRERFDWQFLHYVMGYNSRRRPGVLHHLAEQEALGKTVVVLSRKSQIRSFLAGLD